MNSFEAIFSYFPNMDFLVGNKERLIFVNSEMINDYSPNISLEICFHLAIPVNKKPKFNKEINETK